MFLDKLDIEVRIQLSCSLLHQIDQHIDANRHVAGIENSYLGRKSGKFLLLLIRKASRTHYDRLFGCFRQFCYRCKSTDMGKIDDHIELFLALHRILIDWKIRGRILDHIRAGYDHSIIIAIDHLGDNPSHTAHTAT